MSGFVAFCYGRQAHLLRGKMAISRKNGADRRRQQRKENRKFHGDIRKQKDQQVWQAGWAATNRTIRKK